KLLAKRHDSHGDAAINGGVFRCETPGDGVQFRLRLHPRHTRIQAADDMLVRILPRLCFEKFADLARYPKLCLVWKREARRHHADDRVTASAITETETASKYLRIAAISRSPQTITNDSDIRMATKLFILREAAAHHWIYAEHREEIHGNEGAGSSLRIAGPGKDGFAAHEKRHVREAFALGTPVSQIRIRDETFGFSGALIVLPEKGEALRIWIGKRAKKRGIRKSEDGCVGANADSKREHGNSGEAGILAQHPRADAQVLEQILQAGHYSHRSHRRSYANNLSLRERIVHNSLVAKC